MNNSTPPPVYNPAVKHPRTPFPRWLLVLAILALVATFIIPRLNFTAFTDWLRTINYQPSAAVASLESSIRFTDTGQAIFRATHPALESNEDFNYHCVSHDRNISILGCYTSGNIYIYDVDADELSGIKESTAAHELLHAAWDRLSASEQKSLAPLLQQVYSEHHDDLASDLATYAEADQLDELHSRIGTQISDLPAELESHYARYFQDQDAVVAFYDTYKTPFNTLQQQLDALSAELQTLESQINTETEAYKSNLSSLNAKVSEFNQCAQTSGCFASRTEFDTRRAALVAEQDTLNAAYNKINSLVETYNQKVAAYNNNILRTQTLQDSINSNSAPPTI